MNRSIPILWMSFSVMFITAYLNSTAWLYLNGWLDVMASKLKSFTIAVKESLVCFDIVKALRFVMRRCTLVAPEREEVTSWHIWSLLSFSLHHDLRLSRRELPKDLKLVQFKASCSPWAPIHLRVCLWHLQGNWLMHGLTTEMPSMSANDPVWN